MNNDRNEADQGNSGNGPVQPATESYRGPTEGPGVSIGPYKLFGGALVSSATLALN